MQLTLPQALAGEKPFHNYYMTVSGHMNYSFAGNAMSAKHRDEVAEETKLVTDIQGRPTARFMFFNGLSRTRKTGDIDYLANENQEANLAFSFQMQLKAAEYYPGLTRRIYLKGYRYNMHLRPRTLLVELGAQNNTVEEAINACDPLAHILDMVLKGE